MNQPATSLIGVTPGAAEVLKHFGIITVQDLAGSNLFNVASQIYEAGQPLRKQGRKRELSVLPSDFFDREKINTPIELIASSPLSIIKWIGKEWAANLEAKLGVRTVGDLAEWPPYLAAKDILAAKNGEDPEAVEDPEAPSDLIPATGRFPTERVQYEVVLLDKVISGSQQSQGNRASKPLEAGFTPIDFSQQSDTGFSRPALGAVLTYTQSWYTLGLSLGHLLHTVALAPGETTRIAVIDWNRQQKISVSEDTTETDSLSAQLEHTRAISEITKAVATEAQTGFSQNKSEAETHSFGSGTGVAGNINQFFGTAGASTGITSGKTQSTSFAASSGRREVNADMSQNICDRTQQAANSIRNRRATAVREVSQSESEKISTRAITNFNHMHAMSVQYYEIVQLYRTLVELSRVTRCLFLPMKVLDFTKQELISRYDLALASAALAPEIRNGILASMGIKTGQSDTQQSTSTTPASGSRIIINGLHFEGYPDNDALDEAKQILGTILKDSTPEFWNLPGDTQITEWRIRPRYQDLHEHVTRITVQKSDGTEDTGDIPSCGTEVIKLCDGWCCNYEGCWFETGGVPLSTYRKFSLTFDINNITDIKVPIEITFKLTTGGKPFVFKHTLLPKGDGSNVTAVEIRTVTDTSQTIPPQITTPQVEPADLTSIQNHLRNNALYYSQAIWRSLTGPQLFSSLEGVTYQGELLVDIVDPTPFAIIGNYVAFRFYKEDDEQWTRFLQKHPDLKAGPCREDIVPIPSGGVFAEAVLGRFNSAEKLDITRFWNWQDSPIPITAPEIAPIQAGSRAQQDNTQTGQLGQPIINLMNAPALPDPTGLTAALNAVSNGAMFRDMSHAADTIAAASGALAAGYAAGNKSQDVAANYAQMAADLAAKNMALGKSAGSTDSSRRQTSPGTISNAGALINQGSKMDERGIGNGKGANGSTSSSQSEQEVSTAAPKSQGTSYEAAAFSTELGYPAKPLEYQSMPVDEVQDVPDEQAGEVTQDMTAKAAREESEWAKSHPEGYVEYLKKANSRNLCTDVLVLWNFDVGGADVSKFSNGLLKHIGSLKYWGDLGDDFLVTGYTSTTGNESSNYNLSLRRAQEVRDWLVNSADISTDLIKVIPGGESAYGDIDHPYRLWDPASYAFNRRVEIRRIKRLWTDSEEDNYLRALEIVKEVPEASIRIRLQSMLQLLMQESADDRYIIGSQLLSAYGYVGVEGFEWLLRQDEWEREGNYPKFIFHIRDEINLFHPGLSDAQIRNLLVAIHNRTIEAINWINKEEETNQEGSFHVFLRLVKAWINERRADPNSIYSCFNDV
ncbi:OmpA family protein [Pelotomaculum propionicicum]|uniref:OmpA family protein n=1 Tax=Pelotomaculum propionicicum TaxID=258475 RepID=UPI003B9E5718